MTDSIDPWDRLRELTRARIGLRRAGNAVSTREVLRLRTDHAAARDAVHTPLDVAEVTAGLTGLGLGPPVIVTSRARSRAEYLRRPDLGRQPSTLEAIDRSGADIGLVVADGLSATAVHIHAIALVRAVIHALRPDYTIAPPVVATQARVALGDHLGARLGVTTLLMIIGERPGLSVADSLGIYLTHRPRPGRLDAERNCISNIHPPDGLGYPAAARTARALVDGARQLGVSGVALKDNTAGTAEVFGRALPALGE
ncbi:ethanolamine ammonia-lyase subunit EutC [Skermania piniformis]|uniref:Ethanolamine ammonia-lyase small subunit n=1 Tax=Skermania pinensis TaxID=39122 RepID=A0ABX8S4Q7_9ACTN|nr:ethanolamine ammonia-lyase subunit EutC [Skermania piniformis]QXQ12820.1 ethanolamine ammonia-lyase subunit EutC [Skermania piniformis]